MLFRSVTMGMVEDNIRIDGNKVSFSLLFEKPNDPFIKSVVKAAETAILTYVGEEVDIKGNITVDAKQAARPEPDKLLPEVKNIIAVSSGKGGVGKSTVAANELYREDGTLNDLKETKEKVLAGVRRLSNSTTRLVIVTNEVNADINGYSEETEKYRECIGMVNQSLAEFADIVTEVVYGIPVCIRKEQKKYEEYKKNME